MQAITRSFPPHARTARQQGFLRCAQTAMPRWPALRTGLDVDKVN